MCMYRYLCTDESYLIFWVSHGDNVDEERETPGSKDTCYTNTPQPGGLLTSSCTPWLSLPDCISRPLCQIL